MVRADAIAEMTEKATAGDVASQMALADHYITGDGVRTDMVAAVKWLTMAAEHGAPRPRPGFPWPPKRVIPLHNLRWHECT